MREYVRRIYSSSLIKKTISLGSISILANLLGFLIPIYIGFEFGITEETDSFFLSYSIILFISTVFGGATRSVSVPFLKERLRKKEKLELFISSLFYYGSILLGILLLICFLITYILYYNFENNKTYLYILLSLPIFYFSVINSFFYGILNSLEQYNLAELSPISRAIIIFLTIFILKERFGIASVVIGYSLGEVFKFIHLYYVIKFKNKININIKIIDLDEIRGFVKHGSYQILSTSIVSSSPLIDRLFASTLVVGSVSLLDYGDKVFTVLTVILNAFLVIILSDWSRDVINNQFSIKKVNRAISNVFLICLVVVALIYILKGEIIELLYPKIKSNEQGVISMILFLNTVGFAFNAVAQVINRATISLKATKIMIVTAGCRLIINILLNFLFIKVWGVLGIAYSTMLVHLVGMGLSYSFLKFYYNNKYLKKIN